MIVPNRRTLWLCAATLLPASLAVALVPESQSPLIRLCLLLGVVAAGDALLAARRVQGVAVEFPQRLSLSCDRESALSFTVLAAKGVPRSLLVALRIPAGFTSPVSLQRVELSAAGEGALLRWPLTGSRRGNHLVTECRLRLLSPLGLWHAQVSRAAGTQLRVYPNLREERKRLSALFLNRNNALIRPQRQVGQGREFEKLRLYLPGDALGEIHWKATAKRGQLVSKQFQIERTREVYVIVDASRLSARSLPRQGFSGGEEPLLDRYLRSALILGSVAQKQGDLFGVMAFSNRVLGFVRAKSGKVHLGVCRDSLYTLAPGSVNPGYDEAVSFLAARLKRRALLIFLTSLDEPALSEEFARSIRVLSRRHLVCVAMMRPAAAAPLFSSVAARDSDDVYRFLGGHLVWHALKEMQQTLRLNGVQLLMVEDERLSAEVVSKYLDVKRRQQL